MISLMPEDIVMYMQAASSEPYVEVSAGNHEMVSQTLHIKAAKVVAAHAASVGSALLRLSQR